jgi:hypothetical protein
MQVQVIKPFSDVPYYQATQQGPVRTIIVESDSFADCFTQVLCQIAEQGRELATQRGEA